MRHRQELERTAIMIRHGIVAILVALALSAPALRAETLPQLAEQKHLGLSSCRIDGCHEEASPRSGSNIQQNELRIWNREDKHRDAYRVLTEDLGKRIARNYFGPGGRQAHTEGECLDCHSDNVAPEKRGQKFDLANGVQCEACHGGSEHWNARHRERDHPHADNLANGLYPTEDLEKRAELCLSCHFGTSAKFVNHRMYGAGHPRLRFELALFTAIQPMHFVVDDDYRRRKPAYAELKDWAIGQVAFARRFLGLLADPRRNRDGAIPELAFFECHSCHHPLEVPTWRPRPGSGIGPGLAHLNDSSLIMLRVIAKGLAPDLVEPLAAGTRALLAAPATSLAAMAKAAKTLDETVARLGAAVSRKPFGRAELRALFVGLVDEGLAGEYVDVAAAEQATISLSSIREALGTIGALRGGGADAVDAALEDCIGIVNAVIDARGASADPMNAKRPVFDPARFRSALSRVKAAFLAGGQ